MKTWNTWNAKTEDVEKSWWIVDAAHQRVGRVATHIANLIRGKNKPIYTPHADTGDFVIVINTDKMELTGSKWDDKKYFRHSRFFGSLKELTAAQQKTKDSTFVLHEAVRGMLPDNKMSYSIINKMKAYSGAEHPHSSQKPEAYSLPTNKH